MPDRYRPLSKYQAPKTSIIDGTSIFCQAYNTVILESGLRRDHRSAFHMKIVMTPSFLWTGCDASDHKVGLLIMGDYVAQQLSSSTSASALELMGAVCGVYV